MLGIDERSKQQLEEISNLSAEVSRFDLADYIRTTDELKELSGRTILDKAGIVASWRTQRDGAESKLLVLTNALAIVSRAVEYVKLLDKIREKVYHRDGPVSSSVRSWALKNIEAKASDYTRLFGINISRIALTEKARDITIQCYGARGMVEIDSLSGGEKVAVALALRFAMAYVMGGYKLDFVIMDEPTVHLDQERKASLVEIVSSLGRENSPLKQIIVVTHDSEIFENAEVDAVWRFEASSEGTRVSRSLIHGLQTYRSRRVTITLPA